MERSRIGSWLWPKGGTRIFLVSLVVWNPLLAAGITFALGGTHHFVRSWLVSIVISEVVALECFTAAHVVSRVERGIQRARGRDPKVRSLGWQLAFAAVLMPFALPLGFAAGGVMARAIGLAWGPVSIGSYRVGLLFGGVLMVLFFLQRTRSEARDAARAAEMRVRDLETAQLRAQVAALTSEMNPHLLFNALNTVAALMHRDPAQAEEVVLELSDLYRGVLRTSRADSHPLRDEIALCGSYLKIERARFGERLAVEVTVDPSIEDELVPVLLLQPFVENAVKHGIAPRARGGHVVVRAARDGAHLVATVEDDGVGLGASPDRGAGRAIENCEERLALLFGGRASLTLGPVEAGGTRVTLTLPLARAGSKGPA